MVKCILGNVTFVTAKQLPVAWFLISEEITEDVNASTSKKLKARGTYVLRVGVKAQQTPANI